MADIYDKKRAEFHDLTDKVNAIRAKSAPLRAERDAKIDDLSPNQVKVYNDKIKEIEVDLFDLENERAMLVRALSGKTGIRQEDGSVIMPVKEEVKEEAKTETETAAAE